MSKPKRTTPTVLMDKPEKTPPTKGRPKALTNRDYFAGLFAGVLFDKNHSTMDLREIQKEAYRMADFMIAEESDDE
jgi:hypothetical protein